MARLPVPGQDDGSWGDILNDFLGVELNGDGTLKASGSLAAKADDSTVVHTTSDETINGVKTFVVSPVVPAPSAAGHATNKTYVDTAVAAGTPADATTGTKGVIRLTGDLSGTAASPTVPGLASKEPAITAGTSSQYYRGDKTWQTLDQDAVPDGATNKAYTAADKAKLAGIDVAASANQADSYLLDRANHTGTQTATTIVDLQEAVEDIIGAKVVAGNGVGVTYNDTNGNTTVRVTPAGGSGNLQFNGGGTLSATSGLTYSTTSSSLLVGSQQLVVNGASMAVSGSGAVQMAVVAIGPTAGVSVAGYHARGTVNSPTASQTNDVLGAYTGRGYGATGYSAGSRGGMFIVTENNWTDSLQGARVSIEATAPTSTTRLEVARFTSVSGAAVNYFQATNADTGQAVTISAQGDDADIGLNLTPKGTGSITMQGNIAMTDTKNIILGTATGTMIGTATAQKLAFYGATPVVQPAAYAASNVVATRSYDANAVTTDELADVVGTLISDLKTLGLIG